MKGRAGPGSTRIGHVLAAAVALSLCAANARAQMQTYYHAGAWDVFSGRDARGAPVCGMGITVPASGRRLALQFTIGGSRTEFTASKPDWAIPENTRVVTIMQVGLNPPWTSPANGNGQDIRWALDANVFRVFEAQFRAAPSLTLTFPDGNEPPWSLSLSGSSVASGTFVRCIHDLTQQVAAGAGTAGMPAAPPAGPTQPFSPAQSGTAQSGPAQSSPVQLSPAQPR